MLMSAYELALSDDHEGIIELPEDTPVGTPLCRIARPRRPGHRHQGDAEPRRLPRRARHRPRPRRRRHAAHLSRSTRRRSRAASVRRSRSISKTQRPARCFSAATSAACKNGPSPRWLRDRLEAIGLRPISALVDITNFLTFDLNRPLHVFDAGKIAGDLIVRFARAGEKLLALNGREYDARPGNHRDRRR